MSTILVMVVAAAFLWVLKAGIVVDTGLDIKGIRSEFMQRLEDTQAAYKTLATKISSQTKTEHYKWLGAVANPRIWGAGRVAKGLRSESYDIKDEKYEQTMEIDREEIEDDQIGAIRIRISEMAQRCENFKDHMISDLLANGSAADALAYDGLPFFDDQHKHSQAIVAGGTAQSNDLTLEVTTANDPSPAELLAAYNQAVAALYAMKDDQGEPTMTSETGLVVVVPPNMRAAAMTALQAEIIAQTSNAFAGSAKLLVFPWLTADTEFFVLKTDPNTVRPFIFQERTPVEFTEIGPGSEHSFVHDRILVGTRQRYKIAYGRFEFAIKTTLT